MEILQILRTTLRNLRKEGENSPRLIENLKLLFVKLCNLVKYKLIDFFTKYLLSPS